MKRESYSEKELQPTIRQQCPAVFVLCKQHSQGYGKFLYTRELLETDMVQGQTLSHSLKPEFNPSFLLSDSTLLPLI